MTPQRALILAADIGATNTRLEMADATGAVAATRRHFRNADFAAFPDLLAAYFNTLGGAAPATICLAVAGPVRQGRAHLGNIGWTLDAGAISARNGGVPVTLINDLRAQAYGLDSLPERSLRPVTDGTPEAGGTRLVIGIGTGFNCAPIYRLDEGLFVPPAETGHMRFAPASEFSRTLARDIRASEGACVVERLVSGKGIVAHYRGAGGTEAADSGEIIADAASGADPAAVLALEEFARSTGGVVGDLARAFLPFGGIYLVGGPARAAAPWFAQAGFATAMLARGVMSEMIENIPVTVVTDDFAALAGCRAWLAAKEKNSGTP